jgi:GNAT superfamily N-acetyltransferase
MLLEAQEYHRDGFTVSTDPAQLDLQLIHDYLTNCSYWVPGIPFSHVEEASRHLLTDYVRFAYLMDVFVLEEFRGQGLGKWLMACVFDHPQLERVRRWMLATWDAHGFYTQFGFTPMERPDRFMEKVRREPYST